MEKVLVDRKSNNASCIMDTDEEISNLKKKLLECIAERDRFMRENNELRIKEQRLIKNIEEVEEAIEAETKANHFATFEYEKEKTALIEAVERKKKINIQLDKDYDEIDSRTEISCLLKQYETVHASYYVLLKERDKQNALLVEKRREHDRRQIEQSTQNHKEIERATQNHKDIERCGGSDLISLIVDATSHIIKTVFTGKDDFKLKDM